MQDLTLLLTETQSHWIWAIVSLVLGVIEIATLTLFLVPFILSAACIAMISYIFPGMGGQYELVIYAVLSVVLFVVLKRKIRAAGQPKTDHPNLNKRIDRLVGQTVLSQQSLSLDRAKGSAQSDDDTLWQVRLISNTTGLNIIPAQSALRVLATEGSILLVEPAIPSVQKMNAPAPDIQAS